jgi:tetratricopeptide (TPR) repeat protein
MVLPGKADSGSKGDAKADNPSLPQIHSDPPMLVAPLPDFPLEPITAIPAMVAPGQIPPMATDSARFPRHSQRPRRSWFLRGLFVIFLIAVATLLTVHYLPVHDGEPPQLSQLRNALQSLLTQLQDMSSSASGSAKPPEPSPQTTPSTPARAVDAAPSSNPATATGNGRAPPGTDPISALLDKADEQMGELNYIRPAADNALESYHTVLRLDPGNTDALLGIERIKSGFVLWSDAARARGDLSKAETYLKSALIVDPDDAALGEKLDAIRQERENAENPETETDGDAK